MPLDSKNKDYLLFEKRYKLFNLETIKLENAKLYFHVTLNIFCKTQHFHFQLKLPAVLFLTPKQNLRNIQSTKNPLRYFPSKFR